MLLHGGWVEDRLAWHDAGYTTALAPIFRLVLVDLRGHGESDHPVTPEAFAADGVMADVLTVMDAEGIARASLWGWSYGGSVALQLAAAHAARFERIIAGGAMLGSWVTSEEVERRLRGIAMLAAAKKAGTLEELDLVEMVKDFGRRADLGVAAAGCRAMLGWPVIEPESLGAPTFLYAGSSSHDARSSLEAYGSRLVAAGARFMVLDGLDHRGEFDRTDRVLLPCVEFLQTAQRPTDGGARHGGDRGPGRAISVEPARPDEPSPRAPSFEGRATLHRGSLPALVTALESASDADREALLRLVTYVRGNGYFDSHRFAREDDAVESGLRSLPDVDAIVRAAIDRGILKRFSFTGRHAALDAYKRTARALEVLSRDVASARADDDADYEAVARRLDDLTAEVEQLSADLERVRRTRVARQLERLGVGPDARGLYVDIGGAFEGHPPWIAVAYPPSDVSVDLRSGVPLPDGSTRFVYSAHTLEHLGFPGEALRLAREMRRILEPGGVLRIVVPDIATYAREYASGNHDFFAERLAQPVSNPIARSLQALYPYLTDLHQVLDYAGMAQPPGTLGGHKFGYDLETLTNLLTAAGFTDVVPSTYGESIHPELREIDERSGFAFAEYAGVKSSLFVEARAPLGDA